MKTNRSLLVYILLSILTLGLYSLYFWPCFARDMNVVCVGDGRRTRGILARIIFSALTFGIYEIVWLYTTGDRIRINAHRLNVPVSCTGGGVLAWGGKLAAALGADPFGARTVDLAARLSRRCRQIAAASVLICVAENMLQMLLFPLLHAMRFNVSFPFATVLLAAALGLLCQYFQRAKAVSDENDTII